MKREERKLPGVLHFVVLNFQNQHFWLISNHTWGFLKKKKAVERKLISSKTPKINKKKLSPKKIQIKMHRPLCVTF